MHGIRSRGGGWGQVEEDNDDEDNNNKYDDNNEADNNANNSEAKQTPAEQLALQKQEEFPCNAKTKSKLDCS